MQKITFSGSTPGRLQINYAEVGKLRRASGYIGLSRDEIIKNLIQEAVGFIEHSGVSFSSTSKAQNTSLISALLFPFFWNVTPILYAANSRRRHYSRVEKQAVCCH